MAVDNARIQLEDTDVRAPISGTIIEKTVERGQVISSPTSDVGGGTVLLKMADLSLVQVRTLVDETDIGKIQPGLRATVTVDAYPNRPFEGDGAQDRAAGRDRAERHHVPGAGPDREPERLLKPGHERRGRDPRGRAGRACSRCPNAALRTQRDVASAAQVLGTLDPEAACSSRLAAARRRRPRVRRRRHERRAATGAREAGGQHA